MPLPSSARTDSPALSSRKEPSSPRRRGEARSFCRAARRNAVQECLVAGARALVRRRSGPD
eukprot:10039781-Alexandrium_andersonii.AAC.1